MPAAARLAPLSAGALLLAPALLLVLVTAVRASAAGPALPPTLELPHWAVGFHWTYHYEGSTNQSFAGFRASYLNDTYTSEVVGENSTPRGDAFVLRNDHAGSMSGDAGGVPITGTFTSLTFYLVRKSDLAILNFTQDLNITAQVPITGTLQGSAHNDSVANPPFAQVAFGSPADSTPWRILTNISSTGWFKIGAAPRVNTSSYLALDYNLSVASTQNITVPAGPLPSYNITGFGTADFNGSTYNFTEAFFLAPRAMEKSIDEAGYLLTSFYVNRPPAASALPLLRVPSGGSADLALASSFADPEADPFTIACSALAPLSCSVAPNLTLTVSAAPGVNATLSLNLTADDGLPGGNSTFPLTVLVSGPGNPNLPPALVGSTTLTTSEDTAYTFVFLNHISDPDDPSLNFSLTLGPNLVLAFLNATFFVLTSPANFTGNTSFNLTAFDSAGNFAAFAFTLAWIPVNDPPAIVPLTTLDLVVHDGDALQVSVVTYDVDGDPVNVSWRLDGAAIGNGTTLFLNITGIAPGVHALNVTANDPYLASSSLAYRLNVLGGPVIASGFPPTPLRVAAGSTLSFAVEAHDPDSPVLEYTWDRDGVTFAQGTATTAVNVSFPSAGLVTLRVVVTDGNTSASFVWAVTVETAPPGLVTITSPADGATIAENATVNLTASTDPRLTNLTLNWTLNGIPLPSGFQVRTGPLARGNYSAVLTVSALYNGSIPYADILNVSFVVAAPQPSVNNTTDGDHTAPPPPVQNDSGLGLLLLLAGVAALAVFLYFLWRRSKRPPP